jgi:hypothetical protein
MKAEDKFEKLGLLIDKLDNYAHALKLPLPPQMHVEQLKSGLPEVVQKLKESFQELSGENPWKSAP